jgi:hypothetical protein
MMSNYKICYKKIITKNNLFGVNFIHTSGVIYSNVTVERAKLDKKINEALAPENEVNNDLAVIHLRSNPKTEEVLPNDNSNSFSDSFPWLCDEEGRPIDYNKSIKLFEGIKLISRYLETRYGADVSLLSDIKLSELINPFIEGKDISVLDLFNYISNKYLNDKDFLNSLNDKINHDASNVSSPSSSDNPVLSNSNFDNSKPLGEIGEVTLNNAIVYLKDLKFPVTLNNSQLIINGLPAASNLLTYGLVLKTYLKIIHNRPYPINITPTEKLGFASRRNKQLAAFVVLGAPFVMCFLKLSSIPFKDVFSINLPLANYTDSNLLTENKNTNSEVINSSSSLFLLLNNIIKKVPNWLKLSFRLILLIILVLKLLGVHSILDFFNNVIYFKLFSYISCSLVILYQLLTIYLISKFNKQETKISEFYPEFIINWLKEIEELSQRNEIAKYFKDMCYREIYLYVSIIIITVLI